ncbi:cytosolic protein [Bacillus sp. BGMRC 2118]|nr:cytosolic protein [Bacillus sp. BGMRC 2118]
MSQKTVHPSIQKFKEFVKRHPKLANDVKSKKKTWQELFEDWYLLGEDDPIWNQYKDVQEKKESTGKTDFMSTILTAVKGIDLAQVEQHMSSVGDALSTIHQIISQFKGSDESNKPKQSNHPFFYSKD